MPIAAYAARDRPQQVRTSYARPRPELCRAAVVRTADSMDTMLASRHARAHVTAGCAIPVKGSVRVPPRIPSLRATLHVAPPVVADDARSTTSVFPNSGRGRGANVIAGRAATPIPTRVHYASAFDHGADGLTGQAHEPKLDSNLRRLLRAAHLGRFGTMRALESVDVSPASRGRRRTRGATRPASRLGHSKSVKGPRPLEAARAGSSRPPSSRPTTEPVADPPRGRPLEQHAVVTRPAAGCPRDGARR